MNGSELFDLWAPADAVWSPWAKPVLFAGAMNPAPLPGLAPPPRPLQVLHPRSDRGGPAPPRAPVRIPASGSMAVVVDLPGVWAVEAGLDLAREGFRPVPLFNGAAHAGALVKVEPIVAALRGGAPTLRDLHLTAEAVPAFLLDADRARAAGDRPRRGATTTAGWSSRRTSRRRASSSRAGSPASCCSRRRGAPSRPRTWRTCSGAGRRPGSRCCSPIRGKAGRRSPSRSRSRRASAPSPTAPSPSSGSTATAPAASARSSRWPPRGAPRGSGSLTPRAVGARRRRHAAGGRSRRRGSTARTRSPSRRLGGKLVFSASVGRAVWTSDGTAAGTRRLANVSTTSESNPTPLGVVGSLLLFAADDGVHGRELWATDGTTAGTALVADICPGIAGSLGSDIQGGRRADRGGGGRPAVLPRLRLHPRRGASLGERRHRRRHPAGRRPLARLRQLPARGPRDPRVAGPLPRLRRDPRHRALGERRHRRRHSPGDRPPSGISARAAARGSRPSATGSTSMPPTASTAAGCGRATAPPPAPSRSPPRPASSRATSTASPRSAPS